MSFRRRRSISPWSAMWRGCSGVGSQLAGWGVGVVSPYPRNGADGYTSDRPPAPARAVPVGRTSSVVVCVPVDGGFIEWLMIGTGVSGAGLSHARAERVGARRHR